MSGGIRKLSPFSGTSVRRLTKTSRSSATSRSSRPRLNRSPASKDSPAPLLDRRPHQAIVPHSADTWSQDGEDHDDHRRMHGEELLGLTRWQAW